MHLPQVIFAVLNFVFWKPQSVTRVSAQNTAASVPVSNVLLSKWTDCNAGGHVKVGGMRVRLL